MQYGFFAPPAPPPVLPPPPPLINVWAYKTNGVMGNAVATAGYAQLINVPSNAKSNQISRVSGDFSFQPIWNSAVFDPDFVDTNAPNLGGFF